jgi:hypothetical protein
MLNTIQHFVTTNDPTRILGNTVSVSGVVAALAGWLGPLLTLIATSFSIVWFAMQMWAWVVNKRWRRK